MVAVIAMLWTQVSTTTDKDVQSVATVADELVLFDQAGERKGFETFHQEWTIIDDPTIQSWWKLARLKKRNFSLRVSCYSTVKPGRPTNAGNG